MKDYLNVGEVAAFFGWSTKFVEGLMRVDRIPALEIHGEARFRREDLIDWLSRKVQTLDAVHVAEFEKRFAADLAGLQPAARAPFALIGELLPPGGIVLGAPADNKAAVLQELATSAYATGRLLDRDYLLASLLDRESLLSTALPGGIAICHPRRPIPTALEDNLVCVLRTAKPIAFGAADGTQTSLFFLWCAVNDRAHLYGLARLARILDPATITALLDAAKELDVRQVFSTREREI